MYKYTTLSHIWHGKLYDKSNVLGAGFYPLESTVLRRFGKISHRMGDFVLCKATLENNLIGAELQYPELSSSVTQNSVRQGKMKCILP